MIEHQDYEFLQAFWTRRPIVAYSLFAFNIFLFALMLFAGGSDRTLLEFGAKSNFEIDNGEIWRFVTPIFLHVGILHLAFNSYALWIVGPQVEKLYGGARFFILYIVTGIAGVAASYWYHPQDPSAGASGAIFGLFGVLLVFSIKYRKSIPAFFSQALGKGILMTVAINLAIGFYIPQIDLAAHVGGFVAGCVLAAAIPFARPGEAENAVFKVLQAAFITVVAISFFQVATHYSGPRFSFRNLVDGTGMSDKRGRGRDFESVIEQAEAAFELSESVLESGELYRLSTVEVELGGAIDAMGAIPSPGEEADKLSAELLDLLQKQYGYVEEVRRTGRVKSVIGASPQSVRYKVLKARLEKLLKGASK